LATQKRRIATSDTLEPIDTTSGTHEQTDAISRKDAASGEDAMAERHLRVDRDMSLDQNGI
jgi:hypothetical protein